MKSAGFSLPSGTIGKEEWHGALEIDFAGPGARRFQNFLCNEIVELPEIGGRKVERDVNGELFLGVVSAGAGVIQAWPVIRDWLSEKTKRKVHIAVHSDEGEVELTADDPDVALSMVNQLAAVLKSKKGREFHTTVAITGKRKGKVKEGVTDA